MKKIIGWSLIFLGGLFCINSIIFIPAVFIEDGLAWGERITALISFMVMAMIGGMICRIGFRILVGKAKRSIPHGNLPAPAVEERNVVSKEDAAVSKVRYKYVYVRDGIVSNGMYIYKFDRSNDLFPEEKEDYAYPELPWNFRKAANIGKHILDMGGLINRISIGGGCSEVSHTGTVAYGNSYGSLEAFVENSMRDIDEAEEEARKMYGSWFSGLDYKDIIIYAKIKETEIIVDVSCFVQWNMVKFRLGNGSDGFVYLTDLVHQFGARDYDQGIGADRICWDPILKIFRRIYQLEESRTYFLSSYMDEEGNFQKYSFDVETAEDSHYEILPEKMERLMQILKDEMNQKYIRNPAVGCAEYLQNHSGRNLIELLEKYQLTEKSFHFE